MKKVKVSEESFLEGKIPSSTFENTIWGIIYPQNNNDVDIVLNMLRDLKGDE